MDILVQDGKAHELFPNGAPELHPSITIVRDYSAPVEAGWIWDGSVFTEPAPVVVIPTSVSMRQARLALLESGLLADVEAGLAGSAQEAQIEWEYATTVERSSGLVSTIASAMGLTEQQLDDLFTLAATK